ncbi:hypothetical protein V8C86DRAFT_1382931 [Haematococcus lacustris]
MVNDGFHQVPVKDRLAVIYLQRHNDGIEQSVFGKFHRDRLLHCAIHLLSKHMNLTNTLDVFVFHGAGRPNASIALRAAHPGIHVIPLPIVSEQWVRYPEQFYHKDTDWEKDYLVMGQWRALVPMALMHKLGYEYALMTDDDFQLTAPFPHNIVKTMREKGYIFASHTILKDHPSVTVGEAELASFFIQSRKITPSPLLWESCTPPNITGLYSSNAEDGRGFQRTILYGNFLTLKTGFLLQPMVQDWVTLTILSAGLDLGRWAEQGTIGTARLMFSNATQTWVVSVTSQHDKGLEGSLARCPDHYYVVHPPP